MSRLLTPPRFAAACAALLAAVVSFASLAQDTPYMGVITDTKVEVRSGAGRAYYVVGEFKKGDLVSVQKVLFNKTWYQVRVPGNIHSYVSKAFVDAQGDGETGKINADRTEFKAASLNGPGESYRVQGTLSKDTKVKIIAEEGNFYKIASPADAFVFIPAGTLRQATAADLKAADPEAGTGDNDTPEPVDPQPEPVDPVDPVDPVPPVDPAPQPEPVDPAPQPEPVTPDPVTPDPTVQPEPVTPTTGDTPPTVPTTAEGWPAAPQVKVSTPARSDALQTLEKKVLPYFSLPVTEQPLDKMAKAYQDLRAADGLPSVDQQIITVRLRTIQRRQQILDTLERAAKAEKTDHARTVVPEPKDTEALPTRYTAVGLLMPSTVYDGRSLPLLYRVVDASPSGRTLAYVAPNKDINIGAMMNQLVGIVGDTTYNRTLKLQVIEIKRAVPLEAEQPAEQAEEETAEASEDAEAVE